MRELGRGTIAIAVLGPTVIACSTDGTGGAIATASSVTAAASTSAEPTTTVPPTAESSDATEAPSTTSTDTATEEAPDLRWERVSLGFVSAYVLARGREVAIVDTGSPGSAGQIGEALVNLGANWDDVDHVILTHLHGDHVGGLGGVLDAAPEAIAYAGEADVSGISSSRPLRAVNDGDEVFGLQIIGTPGHTAGHISVLDVGAGFLVAGDALNESVVSSWVQTPASALTLTKQTDRLRSLRRETSTPLYSVTESRSRAKPPRRWLRSPPAWPDGESVCYAHEGQNGGRRGWATSRVVRSQL